MWETILSILGAVLAFAAPFIANWAQNRAIARKESAARKIQEEKDRVADEKQEENERKLTRKINEQIQDATSNIRKEMEAFRQGN